MTDQVSAVARRTSRRDEGFTLIESVTAAGILLVIVGAVITTVISTSGWYAKARVRTEANAVANQVMSLILARNPDEIRRPQGAEDWPTAIPETMDWDSPNGTFAVETSLVATVDPATTLPITEVIVTAYPKGKPLDPAVMVIRYASGWQNWDQESDAATVTVEVQIRANNTDVAQSGVRVQLLDPTTLAEAPGGYAVTDSSGIARITGVRERRGSNGVEPGYFLTCDPRFGTDIRPLHFPERIYPTRVGAAGQPEAPSSKYTLEVIRQNAPAILSVGGFMNQGFYGPTFSLGRWNWLIDRPYQPVIGGGKRLRIYAMPRLNTTQAATVPTGSALLYPTTDQLKSNPTWRGPYSAEVNDYGIARIEIPWTIDPAIAQQWDVWCYTVQRMPDGSDGPTLDKHELVVDAAGGWGTAVNQVDLLDQGNRSLVPQFVDLANVNPKLQP